MNITPPFLNILLISILFLSNLLPILTTHTTLKESLRKSNFLQTRTRSAATDDIFNIQDNDEQYFAIGPCSASNCQNCINNNKCKCSSGFAQDPEIAVTPDIKSCDYKMKRQTVFFALEMFLPFGIGHFYGGRILYGIWKVTGFITIILLDIVWKKVIKPFKKKQLFNYIILTVYSCYTFWQLLDWTMIGWNIFNDGHGIKFKTLYNGEN